MRAETLLAETAAALRAAGITNGSQEARWMLQHVFRDQPDRVPCCGGVGLDPTDEDALLALLRRRLAGEPLQYVLGSTEFYGLELAVGPGVLVPRPETERLVDFALEAYPESGPVCDLCTGSGAIALALARQRPGRGPAWATDLSEEALAYARRNARALGLDVTFLHGDLWRPVPADLRFGLVTANPPYVSPESFDGLPADVRDYEPRLALWAADGGLAVVRRIAQESRGHLRPGAAVLCEISSEQGPAAQDVFLEAGYCPVDVRQDYTGRDRVVVARWP